MSKRANSEGSIRKRADGRWEARATFDGRRKSFFGRTQQEGITQAEGGTEVPAGGPARSRGGADGRAVP